MKRFTVQYGNIAAIIHRLRCDGVPICVAAVQDALAKSKKLESVGGAVFLTSLASEASPIDYAEFEAEPVWKAFSDRKRKSVLADGLSVLDSHPDQAALISAKILATLSELDRQSDPDHSLSIRRPDELLAMRFDDSDRILGDDRLLAKGQSLALVGPGSVGKSRLVLQLAVCCITGREFLGLATHGQGLRWLLLQAENSNRRLQADLGQMREWVGARDWAMVNDSLFIHTLETDSDAFLSLDNADTHSRLAKVIADFEPHILVFDSLYNFAAGDLNSDLDMRQTLTAMSRLAKTGDPERAIIVLHHSLTGRAGAAKATGYDRTSFARNSKVLHAWTRGQINVSPVSVDSNEVLALACGKCSNGREFPTFAVRLNPMTMVYEIAPDVNLAEWQAKVTRKTEGPMVPEELVVEQCKGGKTRPQLARAIMAETGCGRSFAYRRIEDCLKGRELRKDKLNGKIYPT